MAGGDEDLGANEQVTRKVGRRIANWVAVLVSLAVIGAWAWTGIYQIETGEAAVILQLGRYSRTVTDEGLKWHLPPPVEQATIVGVAEVRREKFGMRIDSATGEDAGGFETSIQTADSNIVNLAYVVQFEVDDPFAFEFGMAEPQKTLRDAAQSAVREVVGQRDIDAVLSSERAAIQAESREILQDTLDSYFQGSSMRSPFAITGIDLQIVQPPTAVRDAFDDVVAAQQDEERAVSVARGDSQEIQARVAAESAELREAAIADKEAKILEARGEAERFVALLVEYQRAPEVTRRRLYLETMEGILPKIDMVIIEPDTVSLMPFLPLNGMGGATPPTRAAAVGTAITTPAPGPQPAPAQAAASDAAPEAAVPEAAGEGAR